MSVDQPVELSGVLAGDLVDDLGREAGELLLKPHAVSRAETCALNSSSLALATVLVGQMLVTYFRAPLHL